jgi:hypothetical protein
MWNLDKPSPLQYLETSSGDFDISADLNLLKLQNELKNPEVSLEQYITLISKSIDDAKNTLDSWNELPKDHPLLQIMIPKKLKKRVQKDEEVYQKRKEHFDLLCYLCWMRDSYDHNNVTLTTPTNSHYSKDFAIRFLAYHLYYNNPSILFKDHKTLSHDGKIASWIYHHSWTRDREIISRYLPTISVRRDQWKTSNDEHTERDYNPTHFRDTDSYFDIYADEMAHAIQHKEKSYLLSRKHERDRVASLRKWNDAYEQQYSVAQETLESNAHRIKKYQYIDSLLDHNTTKERINTLEAKDKPIAIIWRLLATYINNKFVLPIDNLFWNSISSLNSEQKEQCKQILQRISNKGLWQIHAVNISEESYQNLVPKWFEIELFINSVNKLLE